MASYTTEKQKIVKGLIDSYTQDTLDNYIRATVKDIATKAMEDGASAIEVADAVFDCISNNYSGNQVMSLMCKQICPKSILLVLRNEIITALK